MSYIETQRSKALGLRDEFFADPGGGIFLGKLRPFVLSQPVLNLHPAIRADAAAYFKNAGIGFWNGSADIPTGHLLSSQIACVNHLYLLRQDQALGTIVLQALDADITTAVSIEESVAGRGYVAFEVIGAKNYLGERSHTRGRNSTSIDAMMVGERADGTRKIFFIEWKYTESYTSISLARGKPGESRMRTYGAAIDSPEAPFRSCEKEALFVEPYYQLMRQTLLAEAMIKAGEYGAVDYLHLHLIPERNRELKGINTSKNLPGADLDATWKAVLRRPDRYRAVDPEFFWAPVRQHPQAREIGDYLSQRYW